MTSIHPPPTGRDEVTKSQAELLREADRKGGAARWVGYLRLSGPGWLQSALKLGAGSMSGSLYLGVLGGFTLLWLQPLALILGIVILSAIGYVVMSTGQRPFKAINEHVSPVLGWGWALAALMASVLWAVPQYALGFGVVQQNLLPGVFGAGEGAWFTEFQGQVVISLAMFAICAAVAWSFGSGSRGVRVFDFIVKAMVLLIVLCFIGVVARLALISGAEGLDWGRVARGFVPDFSLLYSAAPGFEPLLASLSAEGRAFWEELLVRRQRDVMIASAASAAGVNGTFLFAYTLLRKGWGKEFRVFSRFELVLGMFVPFSVAVTCIVIAGAHQFHGQAHGGFVEDAAEAEQVLPRQQEEYDRLIEQRVLFELGEEVPQEQVAARAGELAPEETRLAAKLITRDAFDLAHSLNPLTGPFFAHILFGLGVVGMCLTSITMQMLVCGFVVCEVLGRPHEGWTFRIGSLAAAASAFVPLFWGQAFFWLAIPTSVLAAILIPVAVTTFFLMMNQKTLLGAELPRGGRRVAWNLCLGVALVVSAIAGAFLLWDRGGIWGVAAAVIFIGAVIAERIWRGRRRNHSPTQEVTP